MWCDVEKGKALSLSNAVIRTIYLSRRSYPVSYEDTKVALGALPSGNSVKSETAGLKQIIQSKSLTVSSG